MASHAPRRCCTVGVKHEGDFTGDHITFANGIDAYIAKASGDNVHSDVAILFLPDVIGIWKNSELLADQFAQNGYTTLLVDLFNKDPVKLNPPEGFEIFEWLKNGTGGKNPHTYEYVDPIIQKAVKHLKDQGFKKIGAVGYCFGGKYVVRFMPEGKGIDVGYTAHPSFVEEEELKAIKGPLSIAAAEIDQIFPSEKRHQSEIILKETGQPYQLSLYGGVKHGFAVRCDPDVKVEKFAKEQAFYQAVSWFDEHLI